MLPAFWPGRTNSSLSQPGSATRHWVSAAFRDVAAEPEGIGTMPRPDLGAGITLWHLRLSRDHVPPEAGAVHRPRHFLVYRQADTVVEIVRVLHDAMELGRHLEDEQQPD